MFHSSAIAAAREALVYGVPSIAISLNWKKDETKDSDFKDAAQACLPLINAALDDIEKGTFLRGCLLNIGVPSAPSAIKGFKLTKQSGYSPAQSWQAVSASRPSSATHFMGMHQSLGIQLAQLGKDASAAAAARRVSGQRKAVEVESVATAGKQETREVVKKLFRAEFVERQHQGLDEDTDLRALENGFVSVTPLNVHGQVEPEIQAPASDWLSAAVSLEKEKEAAPATAEAHSAA
ncbi:Survival protein SurE-like phosphatase/nucleotidase [Zea mays]|nr:Survival protein SurE-like phosphatase/nucleotidase [Zea mays]